MKEHFLLRLGHLLWDGYHQALGLELVQGAAGSLEMAAQGLDTHQQVARWVQQNAKVVSLPGNSLLTTGSNPGALSGLGAGGTQQSTRLYDCEN